MAKKNEITQVTQNQIISSEEQIETLKNTIAKDATQGELQLFIAYCNRTGLDPFANQIFFIKRGSGQRAKATFQTSIDGFRSIAENSGSYAGQTEVEYGPMTTVKFTTSDFNGNKKTIEKEVPSYAKIGVYRKDFQHPLYATAYWEEYCPSYPNNMMWIKMPRVMLAKVAEALALRKAFPKQMAGVYTKEEMEQSDDLPKEASVVEETVPKADEVVEIENPVITATETVKEEKQVVPQKNIDSLSTAVGKLEAMIANANNLQDYAIIDGKLSIAIDKVKGIPELEDRVEKAGLEFARKYALFNTNNLTTEGEDI